MFKPACPGFLADVLLNLLAELAGIGCEIEAIGFFAEFDALNCACHFLKLRYVAVKAAATALTLALSRAAGEGT